MAFTSSIPAQIRNGWQVPAFDTLLWTGRKHSCCVVIPVINEGERIRKLVLRMRELNIAKQADIIIIDGGSTDGSLIVEFLRNQDVRGLLVKTGPGKLSAQLRCAYAFALDIGYQGIVTIDGNNKDDPQAIPRFLDALSNGYDFVQASRYLPGGRGINTPKMRELAIRGIHAPLLRLSSGFHWTDTTQGFRAYSRRMLLDKKVAPFRDLFTGYELLAYLSYRVPRLGYRCIELPSVRSYPENEIPTKISHFRGNLDVLKVLFRACSGSFNPQKNRKRSGTPAA